MIASAPMEPSRTMTGCSPVRLTTVDATPSPHGPGVDDQVHIRKLECYFGPRAGRRAAVEVGAGRGKRTDSRRDRSGQLVIGTPNPDGAVVSPEV